MDYRWREENIPLDVLTGSGMQTSPIATSATSLMWKVIVKSEPVPTKADTMSDVPFNCPSTNVSVFRAMLTEMNVSLASSEKLDRIPSNLSPDFRRMVTRRPYNIISIFCRRSTIPILTIAAPKRYVSRSLASLSVVSVSFAGKGFARAPAFGCEMLPFCCCKDDFGVTAFIPDVQDFCEVERLQKSHQPNSIQLHNVARRFNKSPDQLHDFVGFQWKRDDSLTFAYHQWGLHSVFFPYPKLLNAVLTSSCLCLGHYPVEY